MPAVLNAANEVAVKAFLDGRLNFGGIARVIGGVMNSWNNSGAECSLGAVLEVDARARAAAEAIVARAGQAAAVRQGALN
jgi:1-deoxy-D-xylulose-5-phosphate reductoisomerase